MKGMLPREFEGQLDYIAQHYTVCSLGDLVAASRAGEPLPPRPCVLTFDDGLVEHADEVWPRLSRRGWTGAFFASAGATLDRTLLDVHRIHMLLGSGLDPSRLRAELIADIDARAGEGVPTSAELWSRYGVPGRFDLPDANFIKRVLQKGLPLETRREILADLFRRFVTEDEASLADEFYLRLEDLQHMAADGMEIGGHGIHHEWLDKVCDHERAREIHGTLDLLRRVHGGRMPARWFFAYPYGAYDRKTLDLLEGAGCAAALTVRVDLAGPGTPLLELPRIDANDLPRPPAQPTGAWDGSGEPDVSRLTPTPADP